MVTLLPPGHYFLFLKAAFRNFLITIYHVLCMSCHGGFSLDESIRRTWYNPETILKGTGLQSGMVFMDVGCGEGFFSILAAEMVGEAGKVYAVDIDASAIDRLKRKATEDGLRNISATVGKAEETISCTECADVIFFSMVLHDFEDPAKVLLNAKTMLKQSGVLVDLDWKQKQMHFGPPMHIRFNEEKASNLIKQAGLTVENVKDPGPYHYVITAKP
jgi:ubiquinone/menaquinone biosynthesis C-methylase UbiE